MKRLLLISTAYFLMGLNAEAQWNQSFTGVTDGRSVSVANDNVVWISGPSSSNFSYTVDGGNTWVTKNFPPILSAFKHGVLCAVNSTTAYVVGNPGGTDNGIYKTTDNGDTWTKQTTGFNENSPFPDFVYFWNENEGVAVGDANSNPNFEIYTTNNGGDQWVPVPSSNMPPGNFRSTFNDMSSAFRIIDDAIYFITKDMINGDGIFKSVNRGLNWIEVHAPGSQQMYYFDFKDLNNGLSSINSVIDTLYSTIDGGQSWTKLNSYAHGKLKYIPSINAYFSTSSKGLFYSIDDGETWANHLSFSNVTLSGTGYTPSGKIFIAGKEYIYSSNNYTGVNLTVNQAQIKSSKSIDILFSDNVELMSSQDTANYSVLYDPSKTSQKVKVFSATRDNSNNSLVHLLTETSLPIDTIKIAIKNVTGFNGFPVINGSPSSNATAINTGINDIGYLGPEIYPNPASAVLNITHIPRNSSVFLFDMYGRLVLCDKSDEINESYDIRSLQRGLYTLEIENAKGVLTRIIIKQ
jgi:photosystem II stability/assembly factor-like uncharacterized protein